LTLFGEARDVLRVGFKDAAHLTRAFTRCYGVPPSQWRNADIPPAR
jgi:AraC-like DNA-binding protein